MPLDYELVFTYIINAGPVTFTLPLIDNGDCDFHIDLFDTIEPNDYQTTVPMTYVDAVTLQSSNKPLQFSVTAAAYITLDLTDTNLDKDVVNLVGKVVSDEPDTLELPQTFIFTIEIYHRPCEKNLKTDMDFSKVQYVLGQPLLIVELDRFNNNNCDFSLILADKDIDPPVTTSLPGVTLIQATF